MLMEGDRVLDSMAQELRDALIDRGMDPDHPPDKMTHIPPAKRAFDEYKRRGGSAYPRPNEFIDALIERVGTIGPTAA
jgi:hypothetical protein